jgi:hypothetical protein
VKEKQKQKEEVRKKGQGDKTMKKKEIKKLEQDKYCFCVFLVFLFLNSTKRSLIPFPLIFFLAYI